MVVNLFCSNNHVKKQVSRELSRRLKEQNYSVKIIHRAPWKHFHKLKDAGLVYCVTKQYCTIRQKSACADLTIVTEPLLTALLHCSKTTRFIRSTFQLHDELSGCNISIYNPKEPWSDIDTMLFEILNNSRIEHTEVNVSLPYIDTLIEKILQKLTK